MIFKIVLYIILNSSYYILELTEKNRLNLFLPKIYHQIDT